MGTQDDQPNTLHVVNVIESPSPEDILAGRKEGYALVSALKLAEVPVRYFQVSNVRTLEESIHHIADAPASLHHILEPQFIDNTITGRLAAHDVYLPSIHLSAHGNEQGIGLTDGTLVPWEQLAQIIDSINKIKGYVGTERPRGMISLALSCCRGLYAREMLHDNKPWPVFAIIGSEYDIPWSDALTAWVTFYHLLITKGLAVEVAIQRMNLAAGSEGLFQIHK